MCSECEVCGQGEYVGSVKVCEGSVGSVCV